MSLFDGLIPTYTFRLQIERSDRTILDTAIVARATADEVAKAKKNIQRMLNEYTPSVRATEPAPATLQPGAVINLGPENQAPIDPTALPEPEAQDPAADQQQDEQPEEAPAPGGGHVSDRPAEGVRGLIRLRCPECGSTFGTYLKERQSEIACRCGYHIDLTAPLARYRFICPYCEKETWGRTNLEDPEITIRCKCGGDVDLRWNPKEREYQN